MWPCFYETNASGWLDVCGCNSCCTFKVFIRFFDEILLFLYFILQNSCSQMSLLPKSDDVNKVWLWSEGYFYLIIDSLWRSGKEMWIYFCKSIHSIWKVTNFQMYSYWLKSKSQIDKKKDFFCQSWNLFSSSCIKMENTTAYFFAVHRTVFSQHIKMHKLTCHNLS